MPGDHPGFPFRIFLPLSQLLLCLALLWPHLHELRNQLNLAIREYSARVLGTEAPDESSTVVLDVTPFTPREEQRLDLDAVRLTAPSALNIPVGFIQIPFMMANPDRSEWVPQGMWKREWRAVSWPFVGIIFWWMAGRGLEALFAGLRFFANSAKEEAQRHYSLAPKLHWMEIVIGSSLVAVGGATCYVLASGRGLLGLATDYVLAAGAGLWTVLGLIMVSAGFVQWRVRAVERRGALAAAEAV
jgi:hypothetical protein